MMQPPHESQLWFGDLRRLDDDRVLLPGELSDQLRRQADLERHGRLQLRNECPRLLRLVEQFVLPDDDVELSDEQIEEVERRIVDPNRKFISVSELDV